VDQDSLLDAIGSHMDSLQSIFSWGAALAVGLYWTALRGDQELEFAGLKFGRRDAFYVAAVLYLAATVVVLLLLGRLLALLALLDDGHFLQGYTVLAVHPWVLNPFAYLGESVAAETSARWSIGVLIATWWLSITSIALLYHRRPGWRSLLVPALFYVAGLVTLWVLFKLYSLNLSRLQSIAPSVYSGLKATAADRWAAIYTGTSVGVSFFLITLLWQRRRAPERAKPADI
jgi:hypothetical protein